ncbi:MAG: hypothetical protein RLZZ223_452 [Candidatus Parcubacteria bacterium]
MSRRNRFALLFLALFMSGCNGMPKSEIEVTRIVNEHPAPSSGIVVPLISNRIKLGLLKNLTPQEEDIEYRCPEGVFHVNTPQPTPLVVEKFPQECWSYMIVNDGVIIIPVPSDEYFSY